MIPVLRPPSDAWPTPVSAELACRSGIQVGDLTVTPHFLYWTEQRPEEDGRTAIVGQVGGNKPADVIGPPWSASSSVHEYGGRCYAADDEIVYFCNESDQRIYRTDGKRQPVPVSPAPPEGEELRYVTPVLTTDGRWLICVRETHYGSGVENDLVAVATDCSQNVVRLAGGHDFFGCPALSPDGTKLAWTTWQLPDMPWDRSQLWEGDLLTGPRLARRRLVAGATAQSITQPRYSPDSVLTFLSDINGWWNLHAEINGVITCLADHRADLAEPDWTAGQMSYAFTGSGGIAAISAEDGVDRLVLFSPGKQKFEHLPCEYTSLQSLQAHRTELFVIGADSSHPPAVISIDLAERRTSVIRAPSGAQWARPYTSNPVAITAVAGDGTRSHAFYYRPADHRFPAPNLPPPLIVNVHGGPTLRTTSGFNAEIPFWTSRGFAYLDVNYRGSAGFGRDYRRSLYGQWGVGDVADCKAAALHVAALGLADASRMVIRGRSAGGYTALMSLATGSTFRAGASYWGVTDVRRLAGQTHRFESGYLISLIGSDRIAPDSDDLRSPAQLAQDISAPVIIFQGDKDRVVTVEQAELLVASLTDNGIEHSFMLFDGEGHGLQKVENAARALQAEAEFYERVLAPEDDAWSPPA